MSRTSVSPSRRSFAQLTCCTEFTQYIKQETIEDTPQGKVARATRQISERASTRIGRMSFEIALAAAEVRKQRGTTYGWQVRFFLSLFSPSSFFFALPTDRLCAKQGPPTVTIVHKSNVLSVTDGLFRESVRAVAGDYPGVTVNEGIVDSLVYRYVSLSLSPATPLLLKADLVAPQNSACSVNPRSSAYFAALTSTVTLSRTLSFYSAYCTVSVADVVVSQQRWRSRSRRFPRTSPLRQRRRFLHHGSVSQPSFPSPSPSPTLTLFSPP